VSNRRRFLIDAAHSTARVLFVGCSLADSALGFQAKRRRQVVVGGRRVRTVDVHAHIRVTEVWNLVKDTEHGKNLERLLAVPDPKLDAHSVEARLADMDEAGVDVQAVSIAQFGIWDWADRELAGKIVRLQNEKMAEFCAAHPDRFVGLASVAMEHPDEAPKQLEEAVTKLGLRGCCITAEIKEDELSDSKFHPFWAKAEELQALVFIHPQGFREGARRFRGNGQLGNVIGSPLGTTVALSHLIQEGTLDRFPGLKICAAHGGGYLPNYAGRNDGCLTVFPDACKPVKKLPSEYLKQLYYDSILFTGEGLRHLVATVGASQVLMGTDYSAPWNPEPVDHILGTPTLSNADRIAILGGNAAKLLRIGK
jgi:aminocarboxymuconate-semialdehyde decarboxylase